MSANVRAEILKGLAMICITRKEEGGRSQGEGVSPRQQGWKYIEVWYRKNSRTTNSRRIVNRGIVDATAALSRRSAATRDGLTLLNSSMRGSRKRLRRIGTAALTPALSSWFEVAQPPRKSATELMAVGWSAAHRTLLGRATTRSVAAESFDSRDGRQDVASVPYAPQVPLRPSHRQTCCALPVGNRISAACRDDILCTVHKTTSASLDPPPEHSLDLWILSSRIFRSECFFVQFL